MFRLATPLCLASCVAMVFLAGCSSRRGSAAGAPGRPWRHVVTFDRMDLDKPPRHFSVDQTHEGGTPVWLVTRDPQDAGRGRVLAQLSADPTRGRYPLCIYDDFVGRDVAVSVRFKAMTGQVDQAAGIVVRYLDRDNYYVTRANALEGNVRFYKVQKGKRTQLATADLEVTARQWHTLEIQAEGPRFDVSYDGQRVIQAEDQTFSEPGRVGLWTKADSLTYFDDFKLRP
jgi:hypothetical protein